MARTAGLDIAQLHGDESPEQCPAGLRVWKAFRVARRIRCRRVAWLPAEALLLDGPAGTLYGGAGATFDWRVATRPRQKIVLAGGLDESNVREAIARRPAVGR